MSYCEGWKEGQLKWEGNLSHQVWVVARKAHGKLRQRVDVRGCAFCLCLRSSGQPSTVARVSLSISIPCLTIRCFMVNYKLVSSK